MRRGRLAALVLGLTSTLLLVDCGAAIRGGRLVEMDERPKTGDHVTAVAVGDAGEAVFVGELDGTIRAYAANGGETWVTTVSRPTAPAAKPGRRSPPLPDGTFAVVVVEVPCALAPQSSVIEASTKRRCTGLYSKSRRIREGRRGPARARRTFASTS